MSQVYMSPDQDPDMVAAMHQARATFRFFWRELAWERRRIIPGLDLACVKAPFSDPPSVDCESSSTNGVEAPRVEQMWIDQIDFDGQEVSGCLINSPKWLTRIQEGEHYQFPISGVSDWMYVVSGKVYGAFTVQRLRARMDRRERTAHDRAWGLEFGDPEAPEIVPKKWFEAKVKTSFMQKLLGSTPPLPLNWEELEHPMAENMVDSLARSIDQDPSHLATVDERGFTILHHLSLVGATMCVDMLLKKGADPRTTTRTGFTAAELAESLNWKQTAALLRAHTPTAGPN